MNYWLFSIMYEHYPQTWPKMVRMGIAAQHYPPDWTNEGKNLKHLQQLKRGDKIIAAFHNHRFGGYGTLTSDFYRGGPSMAIKGRNGIYEFQERADCEWTTLPLWGERSYINLHDLKARGYKIDLTIGLCVKQIDRETFEAIKDELDRAGAKPHLPSSNARSKATGLAGVRSSDEARAFDRIAELCRSHESDSPVMPPTIIYNEGWMLRLVLDRLAALRLEKKSFELAIPEACVWYSEALLPSPFPPRFRADELGESWTHVDGAIGHFSVGKGAKSDLRLNRDATHFVIVEAKMHCGLAKGVKNAPYYGQAARNIACMARALEKAEKEPGQMETLGFYVIAPDEQIRKGLFRAQLRKETICRSAKRRAIEYFGGKNDWYETKISPLVNRLYKRKEIRGLSWERILEFLRLSDPDAGWLEEFYERCKTYNQPKDSRQG